MRAIEIFCLRRVRDKPRARALITDRAGLGDADAQAVLNQAIGGGRPVLSLPGDAAARDCILALASTGFVARFAPAPDFDAAERAQAAVLAVQQRLPPEVSAAAGAWLLAGDWAAALDHCLTHLRVHAPAQDAQRQLLARAAVETGLVAGPPGRA